MSSLLWLCATGKGGHDGPSWRWSTAFRVVQGRCMPVCVAVCLHMGGCRRLTFVLNSKDATTPRKNLTDAHWTPREFALYLLPRTDTHTHTPACGNTQAHTHTYTPIVTLTASVCTMHTLLQSFYSFFRVLVLLAASDDFTYLPLLMFPLVAGFKVQNQSKIGKNPRFFVVCFYRLKSQCVALRSHVSSIR